jgi:hypothetical protein
VVTIDDTDRWHPLVESAAYRRRVADEHLEVLRGRRRRPSASLLRNRPRGRGLRWMAAAERRRQRDRPGLRDRVEALDGCSARLLDRRWDAHPGRRSRSAPDSRPRRLSGTARCRLTRAPRG